VGALGRSGAAAADGLVDQAGAGRSDDTMEHSPTAIGPSSPLYEEIADCEIRSAFLRRRQENPACLSSFAMSASDQHCLVSAVGEQ